MHHDRNLISALKIRFVIHIFLIRRIGVSFRTGALRFFFFYDAREIKMEQKSITYLLLDVPNRDFQ